MTKRDLLIALLGRYISQRNIKMRNQLIIYRQILEQGKTLKPHQMKNLVKFLKWNLKMNEEQVAKHFGGLVSKGIVPPIERASLEEFFV